MSSENSDTDLLTLAAELTSAWLANPHTTASIKDAPALLKEVHGVVLRLAKEPVLPSEAATTLEFTPAVTVRKSLASVDHIVSMIDGKPYRTLKRHLAAHGLTPDDYRNRYGLKPDYPMVAPSYAEMRRGIAMQTGLGRKPAPRSKSGKSPRAKLSLFAR